MRKTEKKKEGITHRLMGNVIYVWSGLDCDVCSIVDLLGCLIVE